MRITNILVSLAFVLGVAAAPAVEARQANVVQFQMWNGDCGAQGAHTWGMVLKSRKDTESCFPLAEDTHALDIGMIEEGCRVTAFKGAMCDDYPENGAWREETGCLWSSSIYKSWKLTCEE